MRRTINIYILLLILCNISLSCSHLSSQHNLLKKADSLIYIDPKAAFCLLESIHDPHFMNKEDQATYALLKTKATDKCYFEHYNDSLISIAVNFYKNKTNNNKTAESYFYLGRVYQDNNDILGAIKAYLNAIDATPNNQELKVLIYDNLAECYKAQDQYEKAMDMYQQSYYINSLQNKQDAILYSIRGIASVYILQDSLRTALKYYQKALSVLQNSNDSTWKSSILCDIARTYEAIGEYKLAKKYINLSIENTAAHDDLSANYYWKGKILYDLHDYDSTVYYFQAISDKSDINMQASIFHILYNINKVKGNLHSSLLYNDSAIIFYDSIQRMIYNTEINNISREHSIKRYEQQFTAKFKKNLLVITSFTILGLGLTIFLSIQAHNQNKKKQIQLQQRLIELQKEKKSLKDELSILTNTHKNNEQNNAKMQNKLFDLWIQTLHTCAHLFKTTPSFKKILLIENSKIKKNKELVHEDIITIQQEIHRIFAETFQELNAMGFHLTHEDQLFCVLNFLNFSTETIKICMEVESTQALTQRKYRIRKQLNLPIFQLIFTSTFLKA